MMKFKKISNCGEIHVKIQNDSDDRKWYHYRHVWTCLQISKHGEIHVKIQNDANDRKRYLFGHVQTCLKLKYDKNMHILNKFQKCLMKTKWFLRPLSRGSRSKMDEGHSSQINWPLQTLCIFGKFYGLTNHVQNSIFWSV